MAERELHCDTCGDRQLFEAPPCLDGHGSTCPELACTRCGSALLLAPLPPITRTLLPRITPRQAA
ncbi:hypothetical protein [Micromonospora sp. DT229]|uniref:hypothetical protein n=1 Tax=Micromonospora sp. DT229 TaxID=3393430 RepID=UPI003CE93960